MRGEHPVSAAGDLRDPAAELSCAVERACRELERLDRASAEGLVASLCDRFVTDLVPDLAATEETVLRHVSPELAGELRDNHLRIRLLIERIEMLRDSLARDRGRRGVGKLVRALREMQSALDFHRTRWQIAVLQLAREVRDRDLCDLVQQFNAAADAARERVVLIAQPATPERSSVVLRKRPDLDTAYRITLGELEGRPRQ